MLAVLDSTAKLAKIPIAFINREPKEFPRAHL